MSNKIIIVFLIISIILSIVSLIISITKKGKPGKDGTPGKAGTPGTSGKSGTPGSNTDDYGAIIIDLDTRLKSLKKEYEKHGEALVQIRDKFANYVTKTSLTSTLKDYIKLDKNGTSTKYAIRGHDTQPGNKNEGTAWLGTEGQDNDLSEKWQHAEWINSYRPNYPHAKKDTALPITFARWKD